MLLVSAEGELPLSVLYLGVNAPAIELSLVGCRSSGKVLYNGDKSSFLPLGEV